MNKTEVNNIIHEALAKSLIGHGFKARKKDSRFKKKTNFGFQYFGYPLHDFNPVFEFSFIVGIRFDCIEEILNIALNREERFWNLGLTAILFPRFFIGTDLLFEVKSADEIYQATLKIDEIFNDKILPRINIYNDIISVDRLLNDEMAFDKNSNFESVAQSGVVSAALCGRDDFFEIVDRYRARISTYQGSSKILFDNLVKYVCENILIK